MLHILKSLYAINGIAAILFYMPQIRNAWKNQSPMRSVSLVTFGGWSIGGAVTVLYAWFFAHDAMFTAASLGGMMGAVTMFGIVAGKRLTYRHKSDEPPVALSPADRGAPVGTPGEGRLYALEPEGSLYAVEPEGRLYAIEAFRLRGSRIRRNVTAGVPVARGKAARPAPRKYRSCNASFM